MSPECHLKVLILGLNYAPEQIGITVYTTGLAQSLARRGHKVSVVAGKPYYPAWTVAAAFRGGWLRRNEEDGVDVTRVAHYVPSRPSGARRILHHLTFAISALIPVVGRAVRQRPDLVIAIAPSLIAAPAAWLAARLSGASAWLHIQDFEVEAAFATGLIDGGGLGARTARKFERAVLGLFDRVSSISPAMCRRLAEKTVPVERIVEFRNWADIDNIKPLRVVSPYRAEWAVAATHVALYSGNIANKQGIEIILEAAERLQHRRDLQFVICGDGPNRAELAAKAAPLPNIRLEMLQPKERLGELLGLATIHLLPQLAGAADLVLPSKLSNMLASGRPVVATAAAGSSLAAEVDGCGAVVEPGDADAFASAIERLIDDSDAQRTFGTAARQRAVERWTGEAIIGALETQLYALVRTGRSARRGSQ